MKLSSEISISSVLLAARADYVFNENFDSTFTLVMNQTGIPLDIQVELDNIPYEHIEEMLAAGNKKILVVSPYSTSPLIKNYFAPGDLRA